MNSLAPNWQPGVRVAVIGCGAVTRNYYQPALRRLAEQGWVRSVQYFDPVLENARRAVGESKFARVEPSWQSLLALDDELAIIASPPRFHAQQAIEMLEAGKHVLCEKPMTIATSDAQRVIEAAARAGRFCAVGMVRRFSRTACWLSGLARDTERRWRHVDWSEGRPFRWDIGSISYFEPGAGNALRWDMGAHVVDLLVSWLGDPVHVECRDDAMGGTEANCRIELEFGNGCSATVRLSRDTEVPRRIRIERERDWIELADFFDGPVTWSFGASNLALRGQLNKRVGLAGDRSRGTSAEHASHLPFVPGATYGECFTLQLKNVLNAVRGAAAPWVSGESVLPGIRALEAADAWRSLLAQPWLDGVEQREAERLRSLAESEAARRP